MHLPEFVPKFCLAEPYQILGDSCWTLQELVSELQKSWKLVGLGGFRRKKESALPSPTGTAHQGTWRISGVTLDALAARRCGLLLIGPAEVRTAT